MAPQKDLAKIGMEAFDLLEGHLAQKNKAVLQVQPGARAPAAIDHHKVPKEHVHKRHMVIFPCTKSCLSENVINWCGI